MYRRAPSTNSLIPAPRYARSRSRRRTILPCYAICQPNCTQLFTRSYTFTLSESEIIRLHPFLGGILSLWRQKSNRSNNIRCALTGVHWESGLVTAHASIAGYNCEAAHKCSRLRHSLARAQQLREARSITGKVTPCMVIHQLSWQMQDSGHHHI